MLDILSLSLSLPPLQQITGIPPDGLTPEEIERMRKKFGVSFKFSKFVLDKGVQVSHSHHDDDVHVYVRISSSIK